MCQAVQPSADAASRRTMLGMALIPALAYAPQALALIPDEEDDSLLEKAKANRRARLTQQRGVTRDFLASENLQEAGLGSKLVPVQKAVYKLAKSGGQLESGDLKAAASTLSEPWVREFEAAATAVSSPAAVAPVVAAIKELQSAASTGDGKGSKRQFVALVGAVQVWASDAGVSGSIKGL